MLSFPLTYHAIYPFFVLRWVKHNGVINLLFLVKLGGVAGAYLLPFLVASIIAILGHFSYRFRHRSFPSR